MRWIREYEAWGAIHKVRYVDNLIKRLAGMRPAVRSKREVEPLAKLRKTLGEHYGEKRATYTITWNNSYERSLFRIFSADRPRTSPDAAQFLRQNARKIGNLVARGTGVHPYTINNVLRHMIVRARERKLRLTIPERETLQLSVVSLTMQVMQVLRGGYHRIPL